MECIVTKKFGLETYNTCLSEYKTAALDNKLFDHEFSDTKNKQCDGDIQCSNTAVAGPGIMFKEFLVGRDDWIENTLGVKISDDKNDGTRARHSKVKSRVNIS